MMEKILITAVIIVILASQISATCPCTPCYAKAICPVCPTDPNIPYIIKDLQITKCNANYFVSQNFSKYTDLEVLRLDHLSIMFLQGPFTNQPRLRLISAKHTNMHTLNKLNKFYDIPNLTEIDFSDSLQSHINDSPFLHANNLKKLNLRNNELKKTTGIEFKGLGNLEFLEISQSRHKLSSIHIDTFKHLTSIIEIGLDNINAQKVGNIFKGLQSLKVLRMSNGSIQTIATDFISGTKLDKLDLSKNLMNSVPKIFGHVKSIPKLINLSENKIGKIESTDFNGVAADKVNLRNNPIILIETGAFKNSKIKELDFSETKISKVPMSVETQVFAGSMSLALDNVVSFGCDCQLLPLAKFITSKAGSGPVCGRGKYNNKSLKAVTQQLVTDCNTTTTLPAAPCSCSVCTATQAVCNKWPNIVGVPTTIKKLEVTKLTAIIKVFILDFSLFSKYTNLEYLKLENLLFYDITSTTLNSVKKLVIVNSYLKKVPLNMLLSVPNAEELYFSDNSKLRYLSFSIPAYKKLPNLKRYTLENNVISSLGDNYFVGLNNLEYLELSQSPSKKKLTSISSKTFFGLKSIKEIGLENTKLTSIPSRLFGSLTTLKIVRLSGNSIQTLANDCFKDTSLEKLDLSHNEISTFPANALKNTKKSPTNLDLSNNKITTLSANELNGTSFDKLDLSGNPITTIDPSFMAGGTVKELDLSNTKLTSLPEILESVFKSSGTKINLSGISDWQCDCSSLWLGRYLTASSSSNAASCSSSGKYSGNDLINATPQLEMDCLTTTTTATSTTTKSSTTPLKTTTTITPKVSATTIYTTGSSKASAMSSLKVTKTNILTASTDPNPTASTISIKSKSNYPLISNSQQSRKTGKTTIPTTKQSTNTNKQINNLTSSPSYINPGSSSGNTGSKGSNGSNKHNSTGSNGLNKHNPKGSNGSGGPNKQNNTSIIGGKSGGVSPLVRNRNNNINMTGIHDTDDDGNDGNLRLMLVVLVVMVAVALILTATFVTVGFILCQRKKDQEKEEMKKARDWMRGNQVGVIPEHPPKKEAWDPLKYTSNA